MTIHLTVQLLIFLLSTYLSESSSRRHVVYPTIISNEDGGNTLKIGMTVDSKEIVLALEKNRAISSTYKVYVHDKSGKRVPQKMIAPCQYHGTVQGYPASLAVISTCRGISGELQYDREKYYIRPLNEDAKPVGQEKRLSPHELYPPPVYNTNNTAVGVVNATFIKDLPKSRSKRLTRPDMPNEDIMKVNVKKLERRFLELSIIIDRTQHYIVSPRGNVSRTTEWMLDVVNSVAAKFRPYNIIVGVVYFDIWNDRDYAKTYFNCTLPSPYGPILHGLSNYRKNKMTSQERGDVTIFISGVPFQNPANTNVIGAANTNAMCDDSKSTNVNYDTTKGKNIPYLSTLITHEVSHVLGSYHDDDDNNPYLKGAETCECPCRVPDFSSGYTAPDFCSEEDRCIMYGTINRNYDYFSLCTRRLFEDSNNNRHRCLYNAPEEMMSNRHDEGGPICGNAIIEEGETCDCGSDEDCPILDPCCEIGTCQLKNTSSCFTGACCTEQCQFKEKGTVCREETPGMECDFEEVCTGVNSDCPVDMYKQNGRTCQDDKKNPGYCSSSDCLTIESQCKYLFGNRATAGSTECFKANTKGTWNSNCGYTQDMVYHKCTDEDVRCGLLQCEVPASEETAARAYAKTVLGRSIIGEPSGIKLENGKMCLNVQDEAPRQKEGQYFDDESEGFIDRGQAQDYTRCGEDLFCKSGNCQYERPIECVQDINGTECGGHGDCNNLNQCHCHKGWFGGDCTRKNEFWVPPTPRVVVVVPDSNTDAGSSFDYMTIIIVLCVAVVLVPLIVGVIVYIVKHKIDVKTMGQHRRSIQRSIASVRRFSSRALSRQGSRTAAASPGKVKNSPFVTQYTSNPVRPLESSVPYETLDEPEPCPIQLHDPTIVQPFGQPAKPASCLTSLTTGIRVPKVGDNPAPLAKANKAPAGVVKVPPAPSASQDKSRGSGQKVAPAKPNGVRPPPPTPAKPTWKVSAASSPSSSTTKINGKPPPAQSGGDFSLRNARAGLRPARLDSRTHSDTFRNVNVPLNTLNSSDKPLSESNISKKPALQPPKLLAGRSRESKKLQISGPTGTDGSLRGLDGRPKSICSATDIKRSSDSISAFSSTRALFDPQTKSKSRWP